MPVYNGARTVEAAVRDLLRQTHKEFEIIVYDDGSTDATPDIIERLHHEDSRVVLHRADGNRGRGFARNKLLELTSGAILAWQDADDSWHPRKLELQLGVLLPLLAQGTRAAVLSTYEVATQGEPDKQIKTPPSIINADHIFSNSYRSYHFQLQAVIGESDLFAGAGGFDEEMNWSEDIDLALKLIRAGVLLVGHDSTEPLAVYNHSLGRARVAMVEESQAKLVGRFGDFARSCGYDLERILSLRNVGYIGQIYLQSHRPQKALDIALRALISIDPSKPGDMDRVGIISKMIMSIFKGRDGGGPSSQGSSGKPAQGQGKGQGKGQGQGGGAGNRPGGGQGRLAGAGKPGSAAKAN